MSFLSIPNIRISGISACVPRNKVDVKDFDLFSSEDAENFSKTTGVISRRVAASEICASDLCFEAANTLIKTLNWNKDEIECLVYVTQTPDYLLPATSPILQNKLGLPQSCMTLDISLGCSGWVYGLSVISSLISHGSIKKGILLSGDTILKTCSVNDKSTYPLFGDAGGATALEFDPQAIPLQFNLMSDGDGADVIKINDGGYRNIVNDLSFLDNQFNIGVTHNKLQLHLEGMDVFTFGISKAPKSIIQLINHFELNIEEIDYFTMHQANRMMNEKIKSKLKIQDDKFPYSMSKFGNTSCASIPITMVSELKGKLESQKLKHIACGFGVGLSWGSVYFETENVVIPELVEI
jgi:3-oxoacyl-[acyl-carrier-protein] synthase III